MSEDSDYDFGHDVGYDKGYEVGKEDGFESGENSRNVQVEELYAQIDELEAEKAEVLDALNNVYSAIEGLI